MEWREGCWCGVEWREGRGVKWRKGCGRGLEWSEGVGGTGRLVWCGMERGVPGVGVGWNGERGVGVGGGGEWRERRRVE